MNFCLKYHNDILKEYPDFNEIIIKLFDEDLTPVVDFVSKNKNNRLILNVTQYTIEDEEKIARMTTILKDLNMTVLLSFNQLNLSQKLKIEGVPFFFCEVAETWDALVALINAGVSDVYIGSELGFSIIDVAQLCHKKNVKVRVFANVAQTSAFISNTTNLSAFFIRPEDLNKYEKYIDVIEFFGPLDRQGILLKIYKRGNWNGNLSDIIVGYKKEIANQAIAPQFSNIRLKCHKRCNQDKCNLCFQIEEIAEMVDSLGFRFRGNEHEKNKG